MKTERFDEYHKYGCDFYGKLVVVDYTAEVMSKASLAYTKRGLPELDEAIKLVKDHGYNVKRVLLHIPEYVVEIE